MSKLKRKAKQQNFWQNFLNEFILFRRDFVFETHLSPEEAAENLGLLVYKKQAWGRGPQIKAETIDKLSEISFEVKSEHPSKGGYSQSAKATGTIFVDNDEITIIEGSVSMGGKDYWFGVLGLMGLMAYMYTTIGYLYWSLFLLAIYGGFLIFMWVQMYEDRNYLVNIIGNAVTSDKAKISV